MSGKPPNHEDLVAFINGSDDTSALTPDGDLTKEAFEALHGKKPEQPTKIIVTVTDDGLVQVGNDLGQEYYAITPEMTTQHITLLMEARQKAHAIRKAKGGKV